MTRKTFRHALTAAVAACALSASVASAGSGVDSLSVQFNATPAPIKVKGDGKKFTQVVTGGPWPDKVIYTVSGNISCQKKHSVSFSRLASPISGINQVANPAAVQPVDHRDNFWGIHVPLSALNPVGACNSKLAQLVAQGQPKWRLLKNGFNTIVQHSVGLGARCHKSNAIVEAVPADYFPHNNSNWKVATDARIGTIECKGHSGSFTTPPTPPRIPAGPDDLAIPFAVNKVTLGANPKQQTVYTKATVNFHGAITTSGVHGKKDVLYRIVHNGAYGPVQKITFVNKSGTAPVKFSFEVPCTQSAGNTYQAGGGSGQGIGGLQAPTTPGQTNGYARIVIVKPTNGVKKSNDAFYKVTCKKTGTLAPRLPDLRIQSASRVDNAVKAVVRNSGAAGSGATKLKAGFNTRRGPVVRLVNVPALAAGATAEVSVPTRGILFHPPILLHVDNPPTVAELNEGNNTASVN